MEDRKVDLEGAVETLGSGLGLLLNLRGKGTFQARGVSLSPEQIVRTARAVSPSQSLAKDRSFSFSDVEASVRNRAIHGDGMTLADGRLQMELASANRIVRVNVDVAR